MIKERLLEVIDLKKVSLEEIQERYGINKYAWGNIKSGKQKANELHIEAICEQYPEFAYWIVTGKTLEIAGQISPLMEKQKNMFPEANLIKSNQNRKVKRFPSTEECIEERMDKRFKELSGKRKAYGTEPIERVAEIPHTDHISEHYPYLKKQD